MEELIRAWEEQYHMEFGEPEEFQRETPDDIKLYDRSKEDE